VIIIVNDTIKYISKPLYKKLWELCKLVVMPYLRNSAKFIHFRLQEIRKNYFIILLHIWKYDRISYFERNSLVKLYPLQTETDVSMPG
jgi:hypothetical protein